MQSRTGAPGDAVRVVSAEMVAAEAARERFPAPGPPEVALLGRSNVGKSSLLNRLVGRRRLARISATPGKTRLAHWYRVRRERDELMLVDLPGYGWARISKSERAGWKRLVESYLEGRAALRGALLLQDLRRDLTEDETRLIDWLEQRGIPVVLALTKADKLKTGRRAERVRALTRAAALPAERVIATSAEKGIGIRELWRAIDALIGEEKAC